MMTDFDSDKFLHPDAFESTDWLDYNSQVIMDTFDDLPSFLDRELENIDVSDALRSDTEIPMLTDGFKFDLMSRDDDAILYRSDSDSGLSADGGSFGDVTVKFEPQSPASSFSSDSTDSNHLLTRPNGMADVDVDLLNYLNSDEDPPLTPPYEPHDQLPTNHNQLTSVVISKSPNQSPTRLKLANRVHPRNKLANEKTVTQHSLCVGSRVTVVPNQEKTTSSAKLDNKNNDNVTSKPIVISAEEFQRLASQGVLRFQNPKVHKPSASHSSAPISVKPSNLVAKETVAKPAVTVVTVNRSNSTNDSKLVVPVAIKDEVDIRTWKRQQRMIKNRESACLSRKRKKEHLQALEQQLNEIAHENDRLREENQILKNRIEVLQKENERYRQKFHGKAVSVFAVLFLLCLNLTPFSALLPSWTDVESRGARSVDQSARAPSGRHLLSLRDLPSGDKSLNHSNEAANRDLEKQVRELRDTMESFETWNKTHEHLLIKSLEALSVFNDCPSYFNKTESLRLANELTGWVLGHTKANATKAQSRDAPAPAGAKPRRKMPKKYRSLKVFNRRNTEAASATEGGDGHRYQVQVFRTPDERKTDFFEAIQRRNDTFYVVSFRKDHLLLPATAHNKTMRPRMSLVMPAVGLNSSMRRSDGSVAMMQIDCEVMDTRLIHITQSEIPNQSRDANSNNQSENATSSTDKMASSQDEVNFETEI